jgi:hypothetical protein
MIGGRENGLRFADQEGRSRNEGGCQGGYLEGIPEILVDLDRGVVGGKLLFKIGGRDAASRIDGDEMDLRCNGQQGIEDARDVLRFHCAEDKVGFAIPELALPVCRERLGCRWIVSDVQNEGRVHLAEIGFDMFEAASPIGGTEPGLYRFVSQGDSRSVKSRHREGGVVVLVFSGKSEGVAQEGFINEFQSRVSFIGDLFDDGAGGGFLGGREGRLLVADDGGLLGRNFDEGLTEPLLVIATSAGTAVVASRRPPIPVSRMTSSQLLSEKCLSASARLISKKVG